MEWYQYKRIDNFGAYPDPVGPYAKPDSNLRVPGGVAITVPPGGSGTVTGARAQPWDNRADSITIKMDKPYNSIATHYAINYISGMRVSVGQHVTDGEQIATAGSGSPVALAFAFTDASVYGEATKNEPFSGRYINSALNPVPYLDAIASGKIPPTTGGGSPGSPGSGQDTTKGPLVLIGEWIAENIFKTDPTVVNATELVSTAPYTAIGLVAIAMVATILIGGFILLVGM